MKRATKEEVNAFTTEERDIVIDTIFRQWRLGGFPDYELTLAERRKEWDLLVNYDRSELIDSEGNIKQTMHALGLAWHYFPHHWGISVNNKPTVLDIWQSDELFKKAIARRLNRGGLAWTDDGQPAMSIAIIRKALMACSSAQRVSNFRPTASASIYDRYCEGGTVWDMSCGFGGRLIGAFASEKVKRYIGCEPSTKTYRGLLRLASDLSNFSGNSTEYAIVQVGSENYSPQSESVDFAFTSPPYFNTEMYSHEKTQSAVKFRTPDEWNEGFLRQTIRNAYSSLRWGGMLALNVANVKSHPTLESDTVYLAYEEGFEYIETLQLSLSAIVNGAFKYEPVFVFRKV